MQSEPNEPNLPTWRSRATQFLLGSILGSFLILVPLSYFIYFTPEAVHLVHYIGSAIFVLLCGAFSAVFGDRFLQLLSKLFESMPTSWNECSPKITQTRLVFVSLSLSTLRLSGELLMVNQPPESPRAFLAVCSTSRQKVDWNKISFVGFDAAGWHRWNNTDQVISALRS